jgi:hypothetical protein
MYLKKITHLGSDIQMVFHWITYRQTTVIQDSFIGSDGSYRSYDFSSELHAARKCPKVSNPCFNGFVSLWQRRSGCASVKRSSRITNATFWSAQTTISETQITENLKGHTLESRVTFRSARVVPVSPPTSLYHWKYQKVNIFRKTSADYTVQQIKNYRKRKYLTLANFGTLNMKMTLKT